MGDISTWSPVDESNTMAAPNGWPEGQATNTVNNCARAMMGAVRRFYDAVTAQLATFLPLSGGTITGGLNVTGTVNVGSEVNAVRYKVSGVPFAERTSGGVHVIYDSDGAVALSLSGTVGSQTNDYIADSHIFRNNAGSAGVSIDSVGHLIAGSIASNSSITAAGNIAGGSLSSSGAISAAGTVSGANVTSSGAVTATGTVSGGNLGTTGNLNVQGGATINGSVTTGALVASSLSVPNIATVGELTSTGNISAAGWINCAQYRLLGVPIVMMTEDDVTSLETQIADLLRRVSVLEGKRSRALEPA